MVHLKGLKRLLKPDGMLVIYVPAVPIFQWMEKLPGVIGRYLRSYAAWNHINAFVPSTLRFFCERAGYKTIEVSPFYTGIFKIFNKIFPFNQLLGKATYVGKIDHDWQGLEPDLYN